MPMIVLRNFVSLMSEPCRCYDENDVAVAAVARAAVADDGDAFDVV